jgi:hypothetical protein
MLGNRLSFMERTHNIVIAIREVLVCIVVGAETCGTTDLRGPCLTPPFAALSDCLKTGKENPSLASLHSQNLIYTDHIIACTHLHGQKRRLSCTCRMMHAYRNASTS